MKKKTKYTLTDEYDTNYITKRMMEVRYFRDFKQSHVAEAMGITQQAYSIMENRRGGSIGLTTLLRFCMAMDISIELLIAKNIPINQENISLFNGSDISTLINNYRNNLQQLKFYESMLSVKLAS